MVASSKFFNESLKACNCNEFVHPNGCFYNSLYSIYRFTLSNSIYFAPIVFMPLVLKIKKLNNELLKDTARYYLENVICGTCTGLTVQTMMCLMRHFTGEFQVYSFIHIPAMLGALVTIVVGTKRAHRLFYASIIQCVIETMLIKRKNIITKLIAGSLSIQTIIFMCCSSLILYAKRHRGFKGFWFLIPNATKIPSTQNGEDISDVTQNAAKISRYCTHIENNCYSYLMKGIRNYAIVGLTLDSIKMLMSKTPASSSGFLQKLLAKLRTYSFYTTAFLTTYIGIYRFIHCYLNRKTNSDQELNHSLAAFFGGAAYMIYPKLTLHCYGLVLSMEILHKMFTTLQTDKRSTLLEYVKRLPMAQILYVLGLASQIHDYTFYENYAGNMAVTIINGVTDNYAKRIRINISQIARSR